MSFWCLCTNFSAPPTSHSLFYCFTVCLCVDVTSWITHRHGRSSRRLLAPRALRISGRLFFADPPVHATCIKITWHSRAALNAGFELNLVYGPFRWVFICHYLPGNIREASNVVLSLPIASVGLKIFIYIDNVYMYSLKKYENFRCSRRYRERGMADNGR